MSERITQVLAAVLGGILLFIVGQLMDHGEKLGELSQGINNVLHVTNLYKDAIAVNSRDIASLRERWSGHSALHREGSDRLASAERQIGELRSKH